MLAAEAARTDRLGKTQGPPKIEPLSDVLAKILQRKEAVIQRYAREVLEAALVIQQPCEGLIVGIMHGECIVWHAWSALTGFL